MSKYYDGSKLLSMNDINGDRPEIYICTANRSAGKTTFFARYLVKRYLKYGEKFCLIYRYKYELDDIADKFFKEVGRLFFPDKVMQSRRMAQGIYHELFLSNLGDDTSAKPCGYAIAINNADQLKKCSHLLSDVERMLMDEFQSETAHYCSDEIKKFISIHTSIARGGGQQIRYVPVIMLSNTVSIINPYYTELGIAERLRKDTKFLRGEGYVLEQGYVEAASEAQEMSAFNRAFANNAYVAYSSQNIYLNDNVAFIAHPYGKSRYICTLRYSGTDYAVREYGEMGIIYCDDKPDNSFSMRVSVTTEDHNINYVMLKRNEFFLNNLRFYFEHGCFRFKDLRCKQAILKALSY